MRLKSSSAAGHRRLLPTATLALLAALVAAAPAAKAGESLPMRKAGLWEMSTKMEEEGKSQELTLTMCIDAEMEATTAQNSIAEHRANCSRYEIARKDDATVVEAECVFNRADVASTTRMSGDFESAFLVEISSTTQVPQATQSRPIKRTIRQEGTYKGADCGDLKPGQARAPNGDPVFVQ